MSDDAPRVRVAVMSLTAEAEFLEVRVRHLREEISAIDTRLDAISAALRGLPAPARPYAGPGTGSRTTHRR
ncbi:hypothetical protein [Streptomyces sp. NPDC088733]|uniref:hypothetical protein n=1 Tax=Streptomyces sp. NPDC088733 TaxID=3365880 RepID=UPI00381C41D3